MPDFPLRSPGFSQSVATPGVNVGASASTNTKGAWVELVAATAFDADALQVIMAIPDVTTGHLLDIAIGGSGSEVVIVSNLLVSSVGRSSTTFTFPILLPAGTRIAARCQSQTSSSMLRVRGLLMRGGFLLPAAGGTIETIGAATADSGGTALDAGAAANTYGAWSQMTATTARDIDALQFRLGNAGNSAPSASTCNFYLQVGFGGAGSEIPVLDGYSFATMTTGDMGRSPDVWYPVSIPAGSRVAARIRSDITDATDRIVDLVLYAMT